MVDWLRQYGWIAAPLAMLAPFWRQVVWFFARAREWFVVSFTILGDQSVTPAFQHWVRKHGKIYYEGWPGVLWLIRAHDQRTNRTERDLAIDLNTVPWLGKINGVWVFSTGTKKTYSDPIIFLLRHPGVNRMLRSFEQWRKQNTQDQTPVVVHRGTAGGRPLIQPGQKNNNDQANPMHQFDDHDNQVPKFQKFRWRGICTDLDLYGSNPDVEPVQLPATVSLNSRIHWWMAQEEWYHERRIPWRRGFLLVGPGGTGKTQAVRQVCLLNRVPLHVMELSSLTDEEFYLEWNNIIGNSPVAVLFDDLDAVFHERKNVIHPDNGVQFDTLLHALSGVESLNGVVVFATVNQLEKLDSALGVEVTGNDQMISISSRPGRFDEVIRFADADLTTRISLAKIILRDLTVEDQMTVAHNNSGTVAQFVAVCLEIAREGQAHAAQLA